VREIYRGEKDGEEWMDMGEGRTKRKHATREKLVMQLAVFDFSYVRQPMNLRYILSSGILPLCFVDTFRSVNMSRNVTALM